MEATQRGPKASGKGNMVDHYGFGSPAGRKAERKSRNISDTRGKIPWINKNLVKHKKREKTFLGWYKVEEPVKVSSIYSKLNTGA